MQKQKGFAFIGLLILLLVICVVGFSGFYVWHRSERQNVMTTTPPTQPSAWQEYKSAHSTVHFSYPSDWQLTRDTISASEASWMLENIMLHGSNNFVMNFVIQKNHVDTGMACAFNDYGPTVALSNGYVLVSTLDKTNITSLNLISADKKIKQGDSGCGLSFYPIPVGSTMGFIFSGYFAEPGSPNLAVSKPASTYFTLPEVQTAKTIFASVSQ